MENWGIDTLGKSFGDSNRLNLQNIDFPEWFNRISSTRIVDIIECTLKNNEKLKPKRIDKVVSIVKERIKIFEKNTGLF